MLDIKEIRRNPEEIKDRISTRGRYLRFLIDDIVMYDKWLSEERSFYDSCQSERKSLSKGKQTEGQRSASIWFKQCSNEASAEITKLENKLEKLMMLCPNVPDKTVPIGMVDLNSDETLDRFKYITLLYAQKV